MNDVVIDYQPRTRVPTQDEVLGSWSISASQGYCAVFELEGRWKVYRRTEGGWTEATRGSREAAEQVIYDLVQRAREIWDGWVAAGEHDIRGNQVIRCGHTLYTVQPRPPDTYPRAYWGFAGRHWRFRMLSTGQVVDTENLFFQGDIPTDYRDRLPDNAEQLPALQGWQTEQAGQRPS